MDGNRLINRACHDRLTVYDLQQYIAAGKNVNYQQKEDPNGYMKGYTALMMTAVHGRPRLTQMLLDANAYVNMQDNNGWTALHWATDNSKPAVIAQLIKAGANVSLRNNKNETALESATQKNRYKAIEALTSAVAQRARDEDAKQREAQAQAATLASAVPKHNTPPKDDAKRRDPEVEVALVLSDDDNETLKLKNELSNWLYKHLKVKKASEAYAHKAVEEGYDLASLREDLKKEEDMNAWCIEMGMKKGHAVRITNAWRNTWKTVQSPSHQAHEESKNRSVNFNIAKLETEIELCDHKDVRAGSFKEVFKCRMEIKGEWTDVAIARIQKELSEQEKSNLFQELLTHKELSPEFVVRVLGQALEHPKLLIVYEWMPFTLLEHVQHLTNGGQLLKRHVALELMINVARCVSYLHTQEIIHRDLKPANVMISDAGQVKVIDFGLAADNLASSALFHESDKGTPLYKAPEVKMSLTTKKADVFSLGMIMYFIATGHEPYHYHHCTEPGQCNHGDIHDSTFRANFRELVFKENGIRPQFTQEHRDLYGQDVIRLIEKCWNHNADKRDSAEAVVALLTVYSQQS